MKKVNWVIVWMFCMVFYACQSPNETETELAPWQEGYMDIHQISTGRGNCAFIILPDGTTMLVDMGDLDVVQRSSSPDLMEPLPNDSKFPAEWVAQYITHFSKPLKNGKPTLDYVFLTHFHTDHIGSMREDEPMSKDGDYLLSGISMLAEYVQIDKLVDRGWPAYDYPSPEAVRKSNTFFDDYRKFIDFQQTNRNTVIEGFEVGTQSQFMLKKKPDQYPSLRIRNIYSNGELWTGEGTNTRTIFPLPEELDEKEYPNENILSSVIKISYGNFDYYTGGDIAGVYREGTPEWRNVETPVGKVVGPVEVAVLNHHAYSDTGNPDFLASLSPQIMIIPVWDYYHPQPEVLDRLVDRNIYPDERFLFSTGLTPGNKERLGEKTNLIQPWGHVVTRVYEGGEKFQVFVLDAKSENYEIKMATDYLNSK